MYSNYHSDPIIAGLKIAKEQPQRIRFLQSGQALFFTDECVHKVEEIDGDWFCNCDQFKKMRQTHPSPICLHSIAVGKLSRDMYSLMSSMIEITETYPIPV